jgi:hypothetical protein
MSAENTTIVKFIESILFEEYKKADTLLNQIVEEKMKGKVKCACEDEKTEPFEKKKAKKKKGKANEEKAENEDNKKPEWLKKIKKK